MGKKKRDVEASASVKKVAPMDSTDLENESADMVDDSDSESVGAVGKFAGALSGLKDGAVNGVKNLVHGTGSKVTGAFSTGSEKIGSFLNLSKRAGSLILAGVIGLGGAGSALAYGSYQHNQNLLRQEDSIEDDCAEDIKKMKSKGSSVGDTSALVDEYAAKAWSVLRALGATPEQAAGALGNMQIESGMDATTIEAIYDEPFNIDGPKKTAARDDLCTYTRTNMRQAYINSGWGISAATDKNGHTMAGASGTKNNIASSAYIGIDGCFCPGIGLFGFTGPRASGIVSYAKSGSRDWWDFDVQMAYAIDTTGGDSRASWVIDWFKSGGPSSPEDAATEWNLKFEGNAGLTANAERQAAARHWYDKFGTTKGDSAYASSIIDLANTIQGGATAKAVVKAEDECEDAKSSYDNSDLAKSAVAYAWETTDMGRGNNGTELFQAVHDAVFPGDTWYMSCDRGVGTAVRWSGYDDEYPAGATTQQQIYMKGHQDIWEEVGAFGSEVKKEDLQPGDILVINGGGHIVMWVGNEAVKAKYPNSNAEIVSASLNERSPGCETYYESAYTNDSRGSYIVYRNKQRESDPQYIDCVAGKNLKDR